MKEWPSGACLASLRALTSAPCWTKARTTSRWRKASAIMGWYAALASSCTQTQWDAVHCQQDHTRQDEARQDNERQDKTRQDKTRQDKTGQCKTTKHYTTQHNTTLDNAPQHNTTKHKATQDNIRKKCKKVEAHSFAKSNTLFKFKKENGKRIKMRKGKGSSWGVLCA